MGQGGFPGGGSAAPELAAGPMSQSCPTSLFLSPLAATAPDSWRQSREACGSEGGASLQKETGMPHPQLRQSKEWPRSHSEV